MRAGGTDPACAPATTRPPCKRLLPQGRVPIRGGTDAYICPAGCELKPIRRGRCAPCRRSITPMPRRAAIVSSARVAQTPSTAPFTPRKRGCSRPHGSAPASTPGHTRATPEIVEHPFGTIKQWINGAFLTCGLDKVRAEFSLTRSPTTCDGRSTSSHGKADGRHCEVKTTATCPKRPISGRSAGHSAQSRSPRRKTMKVHSSAIKPSNRSKASLVFTRSLDLCSCIYSLLYASRALGRTPVRCGNRGPKGAPISRRGEASYAPVPVAARSLPAPSLRAGALCLAFFLNFRMTRSRFNRER